MTAVVWRKKLHPEIIKFLVLVLGILSASALYEYFSGFEKPIKKTVKNNRKANHMQENNFI